MTGFARIISPQNLLPTTIGLPHQWWRHRFSWVNATHEIQVFRSPRNIDVSVMKKFNKFVCFTSRTHMRSASRSTMWMLLCPRSKYALPLCMNSKAAQLPTPSGIYEIEMIQETWPSEEHCGALAWRSHHGNIHIVAIPVDTNGSFCHKRIWSWSNQCSFTLLRWWAHN